MINKENEKEEQERYAERHEEFTCKITVNLILLHCFAIQLPVEPKPPLPRLDSFNTSAHSYSA